MPDQRKKAKSVTIIGTRGYPSYYGGFETAVRKLAPYLVDQGWDVTVYGRTGSTRPTDPDRDLRVTTRITPGLETKSLSTLSYGFTACLDAAWRKPDVALIMNVANGFWLPLLKLRGIPTLVNVDGIEWDRAKWGRVAKWMFLTGAKATARFANRLVFDAREIGRRWGEQFGRSGVFIPYGGDASPELPLQEGLSHRGYVLLVARFVPENTVGEFLEAAEELAQTWPVVIVGSSGYGGEFDRRAEVLANKNPNVQWLGHVSDDAKLHSLWQHAGVYFHGHSVGGTNPALVQAMALGAPIVARETPYNTEVLPSGTPLVDPSPVSISRSVMAVLNDAATLERLAERNRARAEAAYTWEGVNRAYEAELCLLANKESTQVIDRGIK